MSTKTGDREVNVSALEQRLEILEAEAAIRRLIADHQWVSDTGSSGSRIPDWSTWSPEQPEEPDGRAAHWAQGGVWRGSGLSSGFEGFTEDSEGPGLPPSTAPGRSSWIPRMMHFLTNERIRVESSTTASGRWYSWEAATVRLGNVFKAVWIAGRYDCGFVKDGDDWKIKTQNFQEVFSTPVESSGWTEIAHVEFGPRNAM
jgi:SnoaL-like domain